MGSAPLSFAGSSAAGRAPGLLRWLPRGVCGAGAAALCFCKLHAPPGQTPSLYPQGLDPPWAPPAADSFCWHRISPLRHPSPTGFQNFPKKAAHNMFISHMETCPQTGGRARTWIQNWSAQMAPPWLNLRLRLCLHVQSFTHTDAHTHAHVHTHACAHMHARTHTCTHTHTHAHTRHLTQEQRPVDRRCSQPA